MKNNENNNNKKLVATNISIAKSSPKSVVDVYKKRKGVTQQEEKSDDKKEVSPQNDLVGNRYGYLVVTKVIPKAKFRDRNYTGCLCKCDCGNEVLVPATRLKNGHNRSCGCKSKELRAEKRRKDLTGKKFGKLTVVEMSWDERPPVCKCICECGNEKVARASNLISGNTISCGCAKGKSRRKDLTGKRYGKLVVQEMIYNKTKAKKDRTKCRCICDCGNEVVVVACQLTTGTTKSCGCLRGENSKLKRIDLTGEKFGKLLVVEMIYGEIHYGKKRSKCKCICDCGNEVITMPDKLKSGTQISCGCLSRSIGEEHIQNILNRLGVNFEEQYSFEDCSNIRPLRFDFAILDSDNAVEFLIEYDGEQHEVPVDFFGGIEGFEKRKNNDAIKNEYCKKNKIDLLRIPYTMSFEDIEHTIINKLNKTIGIRRDCNTLYSNI